MSMIDWIIIDDQQEEAESFATELASLGQGLQVTAVRGAIAKDEILTGNVTPDGVLMDVDFSTETDMHGTGAGLAQDIRLSQQKGSVSPFPILRFSRRARVQELIGVDPTSDDLFDVKIEKDGLTLPEGVQRIQNFMFGTSEVYREVRGEFDLLTFIGLKQEQWDERGHSDFDNDLRIAERSHLKAGHLIRLMVHPGILIDEDLLAIRLGVDRHQSEGWSKLRDVLTSISYQGVASRYFHRWWARGLEIWWLEQVFERPLSGTSVTERIDRLGRVVSGLLPLTIPEGSPGDRPWRTCLLAYEANGQIVPVDPANGVRVTPRRQPPLWMDPFVASLGRAREERSDPRLDKSKL